MSSSVVETQALTRRYGAGVALDALTVRIEPGITGLIGENGAGKSTFLKILLGLVLPTSGSAQVFGQPINGRDPTWRRAVGYMPEHECLPPDQSAAEFVTWLARCSGFPAAAARERAAEVLRHVGLFEERYRPMGGYSTGMQQRVKLAQALVHDPALLILDEPTNGLDPAGREEMLALIARTGRAFGISVLVSSHLLGELERICDSVVVLERGRLVRAERLGVLTGSTDVLLVEIDGDPSRLAAALMAQGLAADTDGPHVVIQLPNAGGASPDVVQQQARAEQAVLDVVRDVLVAEHVPLLRLARRQRHLDEFFHAAAGAASDVPVGT